MTTQEFVKKWAALCSDAPLVVRFRHELEADLTALLAEREQALRRALIVMSGNPEFDVDGYVQQSVND